MNLVQRREMEGILKRFNDEEMGGGYLYFLHQKELVQMDLCDYSTVTVCSIEDIESIQFVEEDKEEETNEGIYIELKEGVYEFVDSVWIDENGCQM